MIIKNKFLKYLIYFIVFAFVGALFEYIVGLISGSGIFYWRTLYILTGLKIPFIPFYGCVFLLLILTQDFLYKKKVPFIYFGMLNAVVIVVWEFIWGLIGLYIFKELIWNYTSHPFNFMGIISLPAILFWILAGYIISFVYIKIKKEKNKKCYR